MERSTIIPRRASGVLLPVSSLPSPYGIGTLGEEARAWIDFLKKAGQQYWQVLPLGPTGYGDSPYQSFSAFAGNPYLIDLDTLCYDGLLRKEEYELEDWGDNPSRVDYNKLYHHREAVLRIAHSRFTEKGEMEEFCRENAFWLDNYVLYMALKSNQNRRSWLEWEPDLRMGDARSIERSRKLLGSEIEFHSFVQFEFFKQWKKLHTYANNNGVQIIGDIPIYVSLDSADVWANREMFQLERNAVPTEVAGCPPDSFSNDGQLWGNPLYNWDRMARDGYKWWKQRIQANFDLYDVLRIDHFRGLESYYAIPYGEPTARNGRWRTGPGIHFISAMKDAMPDARIIAEDLGFLTNEVRALLGSSGFPGMKVLQFAFDEREPGDYSPYNYGVNNIVFTGTHDNDTVVGWSQSAASDDLEHAMNYLNICNKKDLPDSLIRLAMQSPAALAVVPVQDWLELSSEARINTPSTIGGSNWCWRLEQGQVTPELAEYMAHISGLYGRSPVDI